MTEIIEKTAAENPDLPLEFIKKILMGLDDVKHNRIEEFNFDQ